MPHQCVTGATGFGGLQAQGFGHDASMQTATFASLLCVYGEVCWWWGAQSGAPEESVPL